MGVVKKIQILFTNYKINVPFNRQLMSHFSLLTFLTYSVFGKTKQAMHPNTQLSVKNWYIGSYQNYSAQCGATSKQFLRSDYKIRCDECLFSWGFLVFFVFLPVFV